ncbi:MAG: hypothetical protein P4L76_17865 [Beijerinckiaceae bacterium]|nr:hypothetical protein [Beijerinckiaceae bacterium]
MESPVPPARPFYIGEIVRLAHGRTGHVVRIGRDPDGTSVAEVAWFQLGTVQTNQFSRADLAKIAEESAAQAA